MTNLFVEVTSKFSDEFEKNWNNMLHQLLYEQIQLTTGNRLRPQMCLWGYLVTKSPTQFMSCNLSYIASISVSIEMIHKASLLLDDWIDGDRERHGYPTFHVEHTAQETVLFSLNIIGLALVRLKESLPKSIILPNNYFLCLDALIETIYSMACGALNELSMTQSELYNIERIKEISRLETSVIISNSLLLGYYAGLNNQPVNCSMEEMLRQIGEKCGYLFQVMNDLEVFANPQKLKAHKGTLNADIINNRKNMAVALLYEVASKKEKEELQKKSHNTINRLMEKYHIIEFYLNQLNELYRDIQTNINSMSNYDVAPEWIESFLTYMDYIKSFGEERLKK